MLPPPRAILCRQHRPGAGEQVSPEPTQHWVPWRSFSFRQKPWPRLLLHLRPGGQAVPLPRVSTPGLSPFTAPLIFVPLLPCCRLRKGRSGAGHVHVDTDSC